MDDFNEEQKKWIKSFERVMKNPPKGIWMFVGAGGVCIYKLGEKGRVMTGFGGVDDSVTHADILTSMDCDGGDY